MTRLDPDYIERRLLDRGISWPRPVVLEVTGSTNSDALSLAADDAAEGAVVVADEQTAGRGRLGRTWVSTPGSGLWMSVVTRVDDAAAAALLPLLAGVCVADAVGRFGVPAVLKWPNDVVVEDGAGLRKLAGVLCEADGHGAVVIGIGINVAQSQEQLPVPQATSLRLEGAAVGRADLLVEVLTGLHQALGDLRSSGGQQSLGEYRRLCATLGRDVAATLPSGEVVVGRAVAVADDGRLAVQVGGNLVYIAAGDVIHATI